MINVLGISHKTAPLDVRGGFAIAESEIPALSEKIFSETEIGELVIISTCNRTELYYCNQKSYNSKETNRVLLGILHHFKKAREHYSEYFYSYSREEAIKHLFRVTSGMDSMVIGEDQIVKQVKEAYLFCTQNSMTDAVLMRLFQKSFEVAKKVRTNTGIQQGATSVSYVAVDLCNKIFSDISDKKILLVGLGDTGNLVLSNLRKKGASNVTLCNRTYQKAVDLAEECGEIPVKFEDFKNDLSNYDIVFTATSSAEYIIKKEDMTNTEKQQLFVDLSVPRNIDKSVAELENVSLYGVDDLLTIINENTQKREESLSAAEIIIDGMTKDYMEWLDIRAMRPIIQTITKNIKKINSVELEKYKNSNTADTHEIIEEYSDRLAQKYIRFFIKNLKHLSNGGSSLPMLKTINELFVFDEELQEKLQQIEGVLTNNEEQYIKNR